MKEIGPLPLSEIGKEELEKLYSWSFEDARQAQHEWAKENPDGSRGPIFRWDAIQRVEQYRLAL